MTEQQLEKLLREIALLRDEVSKLVLIGKHMISGRPADAGFDPVAELEKEKIRQQNRQTG